MSLRSLFGLVAIAVIAAGCYPAGGEYYAVSAPEGVAVGDQCGGSSGPRQTLKLERNRVVVTVGIADGPSRSGNFSVIEFRVPPGTHVDFAADHIRLTGIGSDDPLSADPPGLYVLQNGGFRPLKSDDVLEGARYVDPVYKASVYRVELKFKDAIPDSFNVLLPEMTIDRNTFPSLKVNYQKRHGTWTSLVNC